MTEAEVAREYVDAFNRHDSAAWAALFADDAVIHDPFYPEPIKGRENIEALVAASRAAFSDMEWRLLHPALEVDGGVVVELSVTGTNDGPLEMPGGAIPATGKPITFQSCSVLTLNGAGRITEERSYFDSTGVAAQLGLVG